MKTIGRLSSIIIVSFLLLNADKLSVIADDNVSQIGKNDIAIQYHKAEYNASKVQFEIKNNDDNEWKKIVINNGQSLLLRQCDKIMKAKIQTLVNGKLAVQEYDLSCGARYVIAWNRIKKMWEIQSLQPRYYQAW